MARLFSSILTALALVAMSFAMSGPIGKAEAQTVAAEAADGHCADHQDPSSPDAPDAPMSCVGACSGLPAAPPRIESGAGSPVASVAAAPVRALIGILPDHETPPPRSAPVA